MENKVVLDSSVFNKLFLQEYDRGEAIELIDEIRKNGYTILVPTLFLYEVLTIAGVSEFPTKSVYELIKQSEKTNLKIISIDDQVIQKAINICETGHQKSGFPSFYDSSYHALAIVNNCQFVTSDKRHLAKTLQLGHVTLLKDWKTIFN